MSMTLSEFSENSVVDVRLVKLDIYLEAALPEKGRIDAGNSHIKDHCLAELGDIRRFYEHEHRLDEIKAALMRQFGQPAVQEKKFNFLDLAQRTQKPNESVEDYGQELLRIAEGRT